MSGLGSHLVGCAQRIVPFIGGEQEGRPERIADARLKSCLGRTPLFTLVSKWVSSATGGEVFRTELAGGGSQGPTRARQPQGGLAHRPGSSCWVLSGATGQQEPDRPFRFPPDDLWPWSLAQSPVALLAPFDLSIC